MGEAAVHGGGSPAGCGDTMTGSAGSSAVGIGHRCSSSSAGPDEATRSEQAQTASSAGTSERCPHLPECHSKNLRWGDEAQKSQVLGK